MNTLLAVGLLLQNTVSPAPTALPPSCLPARPCLPAGTTAPLCCTAGKLWRCTPPAACSSCALSRAPPRSRRCGTRCGSRRQVRAVHARLEGAGMGSQHARCVSSPVAVIRGQQYAEADLRCSLLLQR